MLFGKTNTSFKIGGLVGIIILLLGITILFGLYQMSKVSQEIIGISEEIVPLNQVISEIRYHKQNQAVNFEKIIQSDISNDDLEKAKENFWFSSSVIDSLIERGKNLAQTGSQLSTLEKTSLGFQNIEKSFVNIEQIHGNYEDFVREIFIETSSNNGKFFLSGVEEIENQLQNEIELIRGSLAALAENATFQIESNERESILGQIVIMSAVGGIAVALGFFISRINHDLRKEVHLKTAELRKANKKLKELDEMKDEFIGIASHELKSPIQPIFGFAELAKEGVIDQKEAWDGVTELATRLQDLANAVLDVSRIERNSLKLEFEKIKLNDLILETTKSLKINLKPGVIIQENLDEDIEFDGDRIRIAQVLRNLLTNAIKFTPKGIIQIETFVFKDENRIKIRISDSGLGISSEVLPKIFEKFVTKGLDKNQSGTGLGLFLCRGIIKAHGGKISANNNPTVGATFEFTLPILQKEELKKVPELFTI